MGLNALEVMCPDGERVGSIGAPDIIMATALNDKPNAVLSRCEGSFSVSYCWLRWDKA